MDQIVEAVKNLAKLANDFRAAASPDAADAAVQKDLEAFDRQFTVDNEYVAEPAARTKFEQAKRQRYDEGLRAKAAAFSAEYTAVLTGLRQTIEVMTAAPMEKDPSTRALAEVAALMRHSGKTLTELVSLYEQTPAEHLTLVHLLENDITAFKPPADPRDAEARLRLPGLIKARKASRLPEPLRPLEDQVLQIMQGKPGKIGRNGEPDVPAIPGVKDLLREVGNGRGIAARPGVSTLLHAV
jgi:hypothetical protein